jgi:hypothetical protein
MGSSVGRDWDATLNIELEKYAHMESAYGFEGSV